MSLSQTIRTWEYQAFVIGLEEMRQEIMAALEECQGAHNDREDLDRGRPPSGGWYDGPTPWVQWNPQHGGDPTAGNDPFSDRDDD